ncbi:hypothetical protein GCM10010199_44090 [Dactylosporangium roseum]
MTKAGPMPGPAFRTTEAPRGTGEQPPRSARRQRRTTAYKRVAGARPPPPMPDTPHIDAWAQSQRTHGNVT